MKQEKLARRLAPDKGHIVVRGRGLLPALIQALAETTPKAVRRRLTGPRNVLRVSARTSSIERRAGWWRPTDVIAAPDLVLERRLTLPVAARSDLRSAIELMVRSQTPFQPAELAIAAEPREIVAGGTAAYSVLMVPRSRLKEALQEHGLRSTGSVTVEGRRAPYPLDLASALNPHRRWRSLAWLLPLTVSIAALSTSLAIEDARLATAIDAVSSQHDAELAALKVASNELDDLRSVLAEADLVRQTIGSAPSSLATLSAVRSALDEGTELLRVDLRDGTYRLSMKTDNALDVARSLAGAFVGWSVTNDGAITRDSASGREASVVALTSKVTK